MSRKGWLFAAALLWGAIRQLAQHELILPAGATVSDGEVIVSFDVRS
jgi:hypothetical protein